MLHCIYMQSLHTQMNPDSINQLPNTELIHYVTYANREDMDFSTQISSNYLVLIGDGDTIIWFEWQY